MGVVFEAGLRSTGVGESSRAKTCDKRTIMSVAEKTPSSTPKRIDFLGTSKFSRVSAVRVFAAEVLPYLMIERCSRRIRLKYEPTLAKLLPQGDVHICGAGC